MTEYELALREIIVWYRKFDFSIKNHDLRDELNDIYLNDQHTLTESIKLQIAINLHFIAKAYNDKEIMYLENEILLAKTKLEAIDIIDKVKLRLNSTKFDYPIKNPLK